MGWKCTHTSLILVHVICIVILQDLTIWIIYHVNNLTKCLSSWRNIARSPKCRNKSCFAPSVKVRRTNPKTSLCMPDHALLSLLEILHKWHSNGHTCLILQSVFGLEGCADVFFLNFRGERRHTIYILLEQNLYGGKPSCGHGGFLFL